MRKVLVAVAVVAIAASVFPVGTVSGGIRISLTPLSVGISAPAPITVAAAPYEAQFADVIAGDYTVTAQAIDTGGNPLGDPITQNYTVVDEPVEGPPIDIPTALTITVT